MTTMGEMGCQWPSASNESKGKGEMVKRKKDRKETMKSIDWHLVVVELELVVTGHMNKMPLRN